MQNTKLKKLLVPTIFIVLTTIKLCIPIFKGSILRGDDLFFHLSRINGINDAFNDGQIIPRIYPYTNDGFGYGSPMFYCDFFLVPAALLFRLGFTLIQSYKVELVIITLLTAFSIFFVSSKLFKNKYAPYIATTFYMLCTYHITDMYLRNALGEVLSFIFIPFVILGLFYLIYTEKKCWIYLTIGFTGLLLSHNISFAIVLFFFVIMLLINIKKVITKDKIIQLLKATLLSIGLVAFFLFPMIEQMIDRDFFFNHVNDYINLKEAALSLKDVFTPSIFDSFNTSGEFKLPLNVGLILTLLPLGVLIYNKKKKDEPIYKFILSLTFINYIFLFATTDIFPFKLIPFLEVIQFPWRFFEIVMILSCLSSTYFLINLDNEKYRKILTISLLSIFLIASFTELHSIYQNTNGSISDGLTYAELKTDYNPYTWTFKFNSSEISGAEYLPYMVDMDYSQWRDSCVKYDNLEDAYCTYNRNGTTVTLITDESYPDVNLLFPITYYKGYQVYRVENNGEYIPVATQESPFYGVIMFSIGSNTKATYQLIYEGTVTQKLSIIISSISILILIFHKQLEELIKTKQN